MANMEHCRFYNTLEDLKDCVDHLDDEAPSAAEHKNKARLLKLCHAIAENYDRDAFDEPLFGAAPDPSNKGA